MSGDSTDSERPAENTSEERFRALFESIDQGFCVMQMHFDADGNAIDYAFVEANAAFEQQTGLVGAVGQRVSALVPNLDESWFRIYGSVAKTGKSVRFENHAPAMNRWFDVLALRAGDAKSGRVALLFSDITERKRVEAALVQSEAALRKSEERHRLVARATNDVVWDWDLHTGHLEWSASVLEHFGCDAHSLGTHIVGWIGRIHPDDRDRVVEGIHAAIREGKESWSDEYRFRRQDETYASFLDRGYIARDASGEATRMIGSMLNLTERRRAEDALREADRRKDEFLAVLAHELRNPLAPVRTAVHLMGRSGASPEVVERARQVIDRQVSHMARLIDDLLDVSRITRGILELKSERCDLRTLVLQTAEDYRGNLEEAGLEVAIRDPGAPVWVQGDPTRLTQMVGNLLHNATRFTPAGGKVTVSVALDVDRVLAQVSVEDTGVGIEPGLLARLFDPFSQAEQGLARSKGGLGLGLALTKGLAELQGGSVTAHSDGAQQGSCFTLRLPLIDPPGAKSDVEAVKKPDGLRVVVIEDNEDAAEMLAELLAFSGHQVKVALDGRQGIDVVRAFRPQVVISDLGLPGHTDGYAVAGALRADPAVAPALMIALSGYAQDEDRRRSREAGFHEHLAKPPDLAALESMLASVPREV